MIMVMMMIMMVDSELQVASRPSRTRRPAGGPHILAIPVTVINTVTVHMHWQTREPVAGSESNIVCKLESVQYVLVQCNIW